MNNLFKRLLIAVPAAAIGILVTWLGGLYFFLLAVILMFILQAEMHRLLKKAGLPAGRYFSYIFGLYVILWPYLSYKFEIGAFIFLLFTVLQVFKKGEGHLSELVSTFFGGIYIPFGLLCLILLRNSGEGGFCLTILLLLMIWGNDSIAYFGGRRWGQHPLAAVISPNKTWEGFLFGILGAGLGLLVVLLFIYEPPFQWIYLLPSVFIVSIFGPLGDLLESKIKRAAGMKDSSHILPGHGGLFDRLDALILAAPAFYLYLRWLQIAGIIHF